MKTRTHTLYLIISMLLFFVSATGLHAQEDLKINSIFEKYGRNKGATMVVLSGKTLHEYHLDKYMGLTLKYTKDIIDEIQNGLESDKKLAKDIKEVINDGIITSGYYQLSEQNSRINRYILYKMGSDSTITLIYMEGGDESEELVNRLFIKKK